MLQTDNLAINTVQEKLLRVTAELAKQQVMKKLVLEVAIVVAPALALSQRYRLNRLSTLSLTAASLVILMAIRVP